MISGFIQNTLHLTAIINDTFSFLRLNIRIWDKTFIIWTLLISAIIMLVLFLFNRQKYLSKRIKSLSEENDLITKEIMNLQSNKETIVATKKKDIRKEISETETNIRILENALKSAKESAVRNSELLSNISYTLRTNLNDIMGFSKLLENEFAHQEEKDLYDYSQNIRSSGQSLLHLLNNMIDISKIEAGSFRVTPKNCKINNILEELIKIYEPEANRKGVKISFEPVTISRFSTDIEALKHILSNLLDNAVKFTDKGFIKISCDKEADKVLISIKDTGQGIDKAYISDIFEPFGQTQPGFNKSSYKGTGLGLPLVKQMLELLHGHITIHSEKMVGTTVTISLPLSQPVKEAVHKGNQPITKAGNETTVPELKKSINKMLIVDGDPFNKLLIKKMVPSVQIITQVSNEDDLQKTLSKDTIWDLILLDTDLQKIDYGIGLVKKYKELFNELQSTPFIALQSVPDEAKKHLCLSVGFSHILEKPISKDKLITILNKAL